MSKKKKIVTIGGGTGTFVVLSGLKKHCDVMDISAIISVADDGGSTGRLRDEFGYLPVGDTRMALAALAEDVEDMNLLRELFLYRFSKGKGVSGHNFGNLFLVAMSDLLKSEEKALDFASKILRIKGKVIPVSNDNTRLVAEYEDGTILKKETLIDEPPKGHDGKMHIKKLSLKPKAKICNSAVDAILNADLIILGPGDLYTSTLSNIVVDGVSPAIKKSKGKLIYITNLFTRYGQTFNFSTKDHVDEIIRYTGRIPDFVIVNNKKIPRGDIKRYEKQDKEYPVVDDLENTKETAIIYSDLLSSKKTKKVKGDLLKRSLVRHDSDKIAREILNLL